MKWEDGIIEIKKACIYEQDARSKVLTMNVVSCNSEKVDKMLTKIKIDGMKCVSFAHATSEEILADMQCNEIKSIKA